jgi:hypothetical protein
VYEIVCERPAAESVTLRVSGGTDTPGGAALVRYEAQAVPSGSSGWSVTVCVVPSLVVVVHGDAPGGNPPKHRTNCVPGGPAGGFAPRTMPGGKYERTVGCGVATAGGCVATGAGAAGAMVGAAATAVGAGEGLAVGLAIGVTVGVGIAEIVAVGGGLAGAIVATGEGVIASNGVADGACVSEGALTETPSVRAEVQLAEMTAAANRTRAQS